MKKIRLTAFYAVLLSAALMTGGCASEQPASDAAPSVSEQETDRKESVPEETAGEEADKEETDNAQVPETIPETAPEEEPAAAPAEADLSLSGLYDAICNRVSLVAPMTMPADFILNYYGIDVSSLEDYVFSMSEDPTSAETVILMKAAGEEETEALCASLETVIDSKRAEMENYLPEQFAIVDRSTVRREGTFVWLVISDQEEAISEIIENAVM